MNPTNTIKPKSGINAYVTIDKGNQTVTKNSKEESDSLLYEALVIDFLQSIDRWQKDFFVDLKPPSPFPIETFPIFGNDVKTINLEYKEGPTLANVLKNKKTLNLCQPIHRYLLYGIFMQVYSVLYSLQNVFTHGDLHAENIILTDFKPHHYYRFQYTFTHDDGATENCYFFCPWKVAIIDFGRSYMWKSETENTDAYCERESTLSDFCKKKLSPQVWAGSNSNKSQDLRLFVNCDEIIEYYYKNVKPFIRFDIPYKFEKRYSTTEKLDFDGCVNNVEHAAKFLFDLLNKNFDNISTMLKQDMSFQVTAFQVTELPQFNVNVLEKNSTVPTASDSSTLPTASYGTSSDSSTLPTASVSSTILDSINSIESTQNNRKPVSKHFHGSNSNIYQLDNDYLVKEGTSGDSVNYESHVSDFLQTFENWNSFFLKYELQQNDGQQKPAKRQRRVLDLSNTNNEMYSTKMPLIKNAITLHDYIEKIYTFSQDIHILYGILMQIYAPLYALQNVFTHCDLHAGNVMLTEKEQNITVNFDYKGTIRFSCPYKITIIDFGRSYYPGLSDYCEKEKGSKQCKIHDAKVKSSQLTLIEQKYFLQNGYEKNVSNDLRLLDVITGILEEKDIDIPFIFNGIGQTKERIESGLENNKVHNVTDVVTWLFQYFQSNDTTEVASGEKVTIDLKIEQFDKNSFLDSVKLENHFDGSRRTTKKANKKSSLKYRKGKRSSLKKKRIKKKQTKKRK